MKPVIIITIAFIFLFVPTTVFGEEGYFQSGSYPELSHSPTVCIFQPNDYRIDEQRWKNWYSDMKPAIDTWRSVLQSSGSGNWEITTVDVSLEKINLLNYSQCDIKVTFTDQQYTGESGWLGWYAYGTGNIVLVYLQSTQCDVKYDETYRINVIKYCLSDNLERSKKMASVLQHEFGHALGLRHYTADNYELRQSWYNNDGFGSPSIMTPQPANEELKTVTQIDVQKVREIYGSNGFGKNIVSTIFNDPIIPEPVIPVAELINIQISDSSKSVLISGNIPDKIFKRGTPLDILVKDPKGHIETKTTTVSKTRQAYHYSLIFDQNYQNGDYMISLRFDGTIFEKIPIRVSYGSLQTIQNNQVIDNENLVSDSIDLKYSYLSLNHESFPAWLSKIQYWYVVGDISPKEYESAVDYLDKKKIVNFPYCHYGSDGLCSK